MAVKGEGFEILKRTQLGLCHQSQYRRRAAWSGSAAKCFQIPRLKEAYGIVESDHFRTMTIQETGGTRKTVEPASERIKAMLPHGQRRPGARRFRPRN